ncbi:hypothetical protein BB560_002871, partial [Smittium megazygosporum]
GLWRRTPDLDIGGTDQSSEISIGLPDTNYCSEVLSSGEIVGLFQAIEKLELKSNSESELNPDAILWISKYINEIIALGNKKIDTVSLRESISPYTYNIIVSGDLTPHTANGDLKVLIELKRKPLDKAPFSSPASQSCKNISTSSPSLLPPTENEISGSGKPLSLEISNPNTNINVEDSSYVKLNFDPQSLAPSDPIIISSPQFPIKPTSTSNLPVTRSPDQISPALNSSDKELVLKGGGPSSSPLENSSSSNLRKTLSSDFEKPTSPLPTPRETKKNNKLDPPSYIFQAESLFPNAEDGISIDRSESIRSSLSAKRSLRRVGSFDSSKDATIKSIKESLTRNLILNSGIFEALPTKKDSLSSDSSLETKKTELLGLEGGGLELQCPSSAPSSPVHHTNSSMSFVYSDNIPSNAFSGRTDGYINRYFDKEWLESYMRELNRRYRFIGLESSELEDVLLKTYKLQSSSKYQNSFHNSSGPNQNILSSLFYNTDSNTEKSSNSSVSSPQVSHIVYKEKIAKSPAFSSANVNPVKSHSSVCSEHQISSDNQSTASCSESQFHNSHSYESGIPPMRPHTHNMRNALSGLSSSSPPVNIPPITEFTKNVNDNLKNLQSRHSLDSDQLKKDFEDRKPFISHVQRTKPHFCESLNTESIRNSVENIRPEHSTDSIYGGASNPSQSEKAQSPVLYSTATSVSSAGEHKSLLSARHNASSLTLKQKYSDVSSTLSHQANDIRTFHAKLETANSSTSSINSSLMQPNRNSLSNRSPSVASITPKRLSMASLIPTDLIEKISKSSTGSDAAKSHKPKDLIPRMNSEYLNVLERTGGIPNVSASVYNISRSGISENNQSISSNYNRLSKSSFFPNSIQASSIHTASFHSSASEIYDLKTRRSGNLYNNSISQSDINSTARSIESLASKAHSISAIASKQKSTNDSPSYAIKPPRVEDYDSSQASGSLPDLSKVSNTRSKQARPEIAPKNDASSMSAIPKPPTPLFGRFPTPPPQAYIQSTDIPPSQQNINASRVESVNNSGLTDSASTLMDALKKGMMHLPKVEEQEFESENESRRDNKRFVPINGSDSILVTELRGGGNPHLSYPKKPSSIAPSESVSCVPFRRKADRASFEMPAKPDSESSNEINPNCVVCGLPVDNHDSEPGNYVHLDCLKCITCNKKLDPDGCHFIDGHIFCGQHFEEYFPAGTFSQGSAENKFESQDSIDILNKQHSAKNKDGAVQSSSQIVGGGKNITRNEFPFPEFKFGRGSYQDMPMMSFANFDDFIGFMDKRKGEINSRDKPLTDFELSGRSDKKRVQKVEKETAVTPHGSQWLTERHISEELKTNVLEKKTLISSPNRTVPRNSKPDSVIYGGSRSPAGRRGPTKSPSVVNDSYDSETFVECDKCGRGIHPLEQVVFKGHNYHKKCFRCSECMRVVRAEKGAIIDGRLYCFYHASPNISRNGSLLKRNKSKSMGNIREISQFQGRKPEQSEHNYKESKRVDDENNRGHKPLPSIPYRSIPVQRDLEYGPSGIPRSVNQMNHGFQNSRNVNRGGNVSGAGNVTNSGMRPYSDQGGNKRYSDSFSQQNIIMNKYLDPRGPSIAENMYIMPESAQALMRSNYAIGPSGAVSTTSGFNPFDEEFAPQQKIEKNKAEKDYMRVPNRNRSNSYGNNKFGGYNPNYNNRVPQFQGNWARTKPMVSSPLAIYKSTASNFSSSDSMVSGFGNTDRHIKEINDSFMAQRNGYTR